MAIEVMDPGKSSEPGPRNSQIANRWTDLVGPIPEATTFRIIGEEAQRVQSGIDDICVMVRLPKADRETLRTLGWLKIRTPRGADVPLATVADVRFTKAPSFVEGNDRVEVIRIGAQPADETIDILRIAREITPQLVELCRTTPNLSFEFKGHVAEAEEAR